jgi:hypothetical protein
MESDILELRSLVTSPVLKSANDFHGRLLRRSARVYTNWSTNVAVMSPLAFLSLNQWENWLIICGSVALLDADRKSIREWLELLSEAAGRKAGNRELFSLGSATVLWFPCRLRRQSV